MLKSESHSPQETQVDKNFPQALSCNRSSKQGAQHSFWRSGVAIKNSYAQSLIYPRKEELLKHNWMSEAMPYTGSRTGHAFSGGSQALPFTTVYGIAQGRNNISK